MAKKALCMGINDYPGTDMDLQGCVNDAQDWSALLTARGFSVSTLLDAQATKAAMVEAMTKIVSGAEPGDSVVITFSGHGSYQPDLDDEEVDSLDEALCPYDIHTKREALIDDEIRAIFGTRKRGVRMLLISDSCHSGTVTRAAPNEAGVVGIRPRFLPMGNWLPDNQLPRTRGGGVASSIRMEARASAFTGAVLKKEGDLLMSGCKEGPNNFSYDAIISGRNNGAFTYYALKTLRALRPSGTYAEWHQAISEYLPSASYPQSPQLVGTATARKRKIFD